MLKPYPPLAKLVGYILLAIGPLGPPDIVDNAQIWLNYHDTNMGYPDYSDFQAACTEKLGESSLCLVISRSTAYALLCNELECVPIE